MESWLVSIAYTFTYVYLHVYIPVDAQIYTILLMFNYL